MTAAPVHLAIARLRAETVAISLILFVDAGG